MDEVTVQCLYCGDYCIKGKWYQPRRAPKHTPRYTHGVCPDCQKKKEAANEKA